MYGIIQQLTWAKRDSIPTKALNWSIFTYIKSTIFAKKKKKIKNEHTSVFLSKNHTDLWASMATPGHDLLETKESVYRNVGKQVMLQLCPKWQMTSISFQTTECTVEPLSMGSYALLRMRSTTSVIFKDAVLVCSGCCNTMPQTGRLKATNINFLPFWRLEV